MKTKKDPRHQKREKIIRQLFADTFSPQQKPTEEVQEILKKKAKIDKLIKTCAPAWPIDKINRIDLSILRLAIYELMKDKVPYKVSIDEAVELAKEYGSETSSSFVNGVLGTVVKKLKKDLPNPKKKEDETQKQA